MRRRQTADGTVADLVEPESDGRNNKEQRELDRDGKHENELVHALNGARGADTLEGLPAERLRPTSVSIRWRNYHHSDWVTFISFHER